MKINKVRALRGPNFWSRKTALEASVAIGAEELATTGLAAFIGRVVDLFPTLKSSLGEISPVATTADRLARVIERVALKLQSEAGCLVGFSRSAPNGDPGTYLVVVEYREEEVGRLAIETAFEVVQAALAGRPFDVAGAIKKLRSLDEQIRLGPSTGSIVRAAQNRGIPTHRLNDGSLVQLGWGAKQRRIWAAETDRTSAIAESIAQDKELTKSLLSAVGVPVPKGRTVTDAEDAWAAAQELGLPVVVKPRDGNQGRGVAVNLGNREQVTAAYAAARQESRSILVEQFVPGADHRLLVIGGRVVAAARREPPHVFGDGVLSVKQLVEKENLDPRRGEDHATSLSKIPIDAIAKAVLAEQRLTEDSIPPKGEKVLLRRNANLSTGGSADDVTDEVDPELAERAVDAARVVGLDIAGVDIVCRDISRTLEEQGGALVEVNAAPGLRMHLEPSKGKGRPVGEAIVSTLFPEGDDGRIPVVSVSGNNGKTTTVRLIAHLLKRQGKRVGLTCTDGIFVDERRIDTGDCSGPKSARAVLAHPRVEAAVLETARGGILREGLGFDRCDVAVVTNIGLGDHLGLNGIDTAEQLAAVKRVTVENVAPQGSAVLNAADPLTAAMASKCPGSVIFFAHDASNAVLAAHRAQGGRVLFVQGGALVAAEGEKEQRLELAAVPITRAGRVRFEVENAMAAVGAAWALGVAWEIIRAGLASFDSDVRRTPGRFNLLTYRGATLVVDYGHNADALLALVDAIGRIPHHRRHVVVSAAGDRRDSDIVGLGRILGDAVDEAVLFEDACNRGRSDGEIMRLLREGMATSKRVSEICEIKGELLAIEGCLAKLRPGDLALVLIDQVEESLAFIERLIATDSGRSESATTAQSSGSASMSVPSRQVA
ncbi:MAG: cyanophycin synthetase [Deltaproteobacteria bacterium]|nr:cyanophycin synthetase [Deltaproteobacteria bacterium]